MLIVTTGYGQTKTFTGSGTFIVPCDVTSITVKVWGAGGAGGGSNGNGNSGAGGGAGGYSTAILSVTGGAIIPYTVGSKGTGGNNSNGGDGGYSSFLTLTANGGKGGGRNGGTIGTGGNASGGSINLTGGNGGSGGGNTGGDGGDSPGGGGTGGLGRSNTNGDPGNLRGGGGGGGEKSNKAGGDGGDGQIEIAYLSSLKSYCTPSYNYNVEPITKVTFAGIINPSTNVLGGSSLESFCIEGTVIQGSSTNPISVKGITDGNFTDSIKVYIDWDQNGDFGNDTNEKYDLGTISNSTGLDSKLVLGNIAVPSTALIGTTMMRVVKTYNNYGYNSNDPCFNGSDYGQAEDYIIRVTAPIGISSVSPSAACEGSTITITGTNLSGATAANVKIGGTAVTSITSNTATQIVAVIGSGTTGLVSVTISGNIATSASNFTVNTPSVAPTGAAIQSFCGGISPTVASLVATGTAIKWYAAATGGSALPAATVLINGTHYYATQTQTSCESTTRLDVVVTLTSAPVITPNKVNETCSDSNNGSISAALSGGLTNVRYIKLTQKYADWQQVQEIQAFEVFTNTNVALSSNGATAVASSVYSGNTSGYGPQKAIDGDATGYSFWHSNSTNVGESITVTLASSKNIDYLRIHNRVDCCQSRGQNMLLELFDASNNLVFSKTVDLYGGVIGAHYIDVNVLDVSWSDAATTLNRTALDSGNYTLNYADALGCTVSSLVNISSINPASVGGTVSGGSTPICQGASTGTLSLSTQIGTIVNWEKQHNGGGWLYAGGSATTFSETPYAAGSWEYRAKVQSNSCAVVYSSIKTIIVNQTPVGGGIYTGNTPICINSSTGSMNLTGYTGSIVRWEKRLLPATAWTIITNTTASYSESPATGGTWEYRAVVGNGSCATVYSTVRSVTVNPELTITLTNSTATVCQNTTTASFAYSATTGSPAGWVVNFDAIALAAGFTSPQNNSLGGATGTISVNVPWSVASGVYNATLTVITYYPVCSSASYPITVTVGVTKPIVGTITQPNCITDSGSVVLSGLPASGTINQTGTVVTSYPITGTTMIVSGLASGTYNFMTSNGTCTSLATANVVINALVTNTWNGVWSNGAPTIDQKIVFASDYNVDADVNGCSCIVTGNKNVVIKSGRTMKIVNDVKVNGTLTFEDTASLVQINNAAINSGNINYKRTTSSVIKSDYTYWSSPVSNQSLNISSSYASGLFYSYDDFASPENWKKETSTSIMQIGKGYIIRASLTDAQSVPGFYNATFVGIPNNGIKTLAIGPLGTSNLIGNPFPSAIDADLFLAANSSVIEGTIYIWTHKTAIQSSSNIATNKAGSGALAYTSDDYASYNAVGGVAVSGGIKPTGKIAAGQAFFTTSVATGSSVAFNNNMRLAGSTLANGTGVNQQFFKTKNTKTDKGIEKNRIWLNLTNSEGAFKQTLLGYLTDATNAFDSRFDGESFDGNDFIDFYSVNQDKNLTIQGRALPFDENDEVPLGYSSTIEGDFSINIDQLDGSLTNQAVFIEDKLTNTIFDLKNENYSFSTDAGTFNDRFVLRYKVKPTEKTLAKTSFDTESNKVLVVVKNKQITVKSFSETIQKLVIYDLFGKQLYTKDKVKRNELAIADLVSSHQALIVKTTLQNGLTQTDKIIF